MVDDGELQIGKNFSSDAENTRNPRSPARQRNDRNLEGSSPRVSLLIGAMFALLALLFAPLMTPGVVLGLIGYTMAQSAIKYRDHGWLIGLVFGVLLMLITFGSLVAYCVYAIFFQG